MASRAAAAPAAASFPSASKEAYASLRISEASGSFEHHQAASANASRSAPVIAARSTSWNAA